MLKPFAGLKIYYSGSINGTPEPDPELAWKLVQYMIQNGADVLSEHVAGRSQQEKDEIRAKRTGKTVDELTQDASPWFEVRRQDLLPQLSFMIRGITAQESPVFKLCTYNNQSEAEQKIFDFLRQNSF